MVVWVEVREGLEEERGPNGILPRVQFCIFCCIGFVR